MSKLFGRTSMGVVFLLFASLLLTAFANADTGARKIVVFETGLHEAAKQSIINHAGGVTLKRLSLVNGYAVWLPKQGEKALRVRGVIRVDDDLIVQAIGKTSGAVNAPQTTVWGVSRISAPQAWTYSQGAGVKVGVLDTGISTSHPDLRVWGGINTINSKKGYNDDNGHGSHVSGIIAASNNSVGVVGVAPGAQLYAVKVLGANGSGWLSDIIEGLEWAIANRMDVVNMSLGTGSDNQTFRDAISRTYDAGITIVAAAGNSGPADNTVEYPAKYPGVIAVSASNQSDGIASFSSRGPEVDLIAPGAGILSTSKGSGYTTMSGTSMAAPHVTGVVALRMAIDPDRSPAHIASVLAGTADSLGLTANQQGAGLVDALGTVTAP